MKWRSAQEHIRSQNHAGMISALDMFLAELLQQSTADAKRHPLYCFL